MAEIAFHADAAAELQAAARYYEEQQSGLGEEFLDEIEQGLDMIQQLPRLWPMYEADYRRYLLRRFPLGVIYRVEQEQIYVIAVAHLHRETGYWYARR